jgi:hypothetical protein
MNQCILLHAVKSIIILSWLLLFFWKEYGKGYPYSDFILFK